MSKQKFAFDKTNFIFACCRHGGSDTWFYLNDRSCIHTDTHFEPDIFSVRRIKVAPLVCLLGVCLYDICSIT